MFAISILEMAKRKWKQKLTDMPCHPLSWKLIPYKSNRNKILKKYFSPQLTTLNSTFTTSVDENRILIFHNDSTEIGLAIFISRIFSWQHWTSKIISYSCDRHIYHLKYHTIEIIKSLIYFLFIQRYDLTCFDLMYMDVQISI